MNPDSDDCRDCDVRPMREDDLEAVLAWRNHPEVRRHMLTRHEIGLAEHRGWFTKASQDASRRLLIVEQGGSPLGFVHFSGVAPGAAAEWGFYAVPGAPRGSGRKLGLAALAHAFGELQVHKVCGQALGSNAGSIRFHESLGFQREGVLREQVLVDGGYQDMVCFGLLRAEWHASHRGPHHV